MIKGIVSLSLYSFLLCFSTGTNGLHEALQGERCDVDKQCLTAQMTCEQNTCNCIEGHYPSEDRRNCIAKPGAKCYEVNDCYGLLNAECDMQQSIPVCTCRRGYLSTLDALECLEEVKFYQGACSVTDQCQKLLGRFSVCQDELCQCQSNYHYSPAEGCISNIYLNEACVNNTNCITKDFNTNQVMCENGKCVCRSGLVESEGSCKAGASHLIISTSPLLMYWVVKFVI